MSQSAIELNIIVKKYVAELVTKLSVKYEFDFDEAMASLDVKADPVVAKTTKDNAKKIKDDEKLAPYKTMLYDEEDLFKENCNDKDTDNE